MEMNWRQISVIDSEGECWGELGDLLDAAPANLDSAVITDGAIEEWPGFSIPEGPHNWDGFVEALDSARGVVD